RVWLNLTNSEGAFKQLLVGYATGATNGLDSAFDGLSISNAYVDFYSVNDGNNFVIQGRAVPFDKTDKVPLGYKTTIEGTFEIKIDHADGLLAKCNIYLKDKNTGILHDLKKSSYSFSTLKGEYNERFVLTYIPNLESISDQDVVENVKHQLEIYTLENQLSIKSRVGNISTIIIYDLKGNVLYQKEHIDKEQFVISDLIPKRQILIVKTLFSNSVNQTDKIIF
ncbi:MAG TPA: T9SS C-terminal target domain-containing protein, partial [Flavobacterium sp.]|uniref:T9SS C-terminal target domain-containing protein n=1 Tax=Flavobacterium sp. TaxID=239 RepID=UPI002DB8ECD0